MDKYMLITIGIVLVLCIFGWVDRGVTSAPMPKKKINPSVAEDEDSQIIQKNESYMTARMSAGYIGIFSEDD